MNTSSIFKKFVAFISKYNIALIPFSSEPHCSFFFSHFGQIILLFIAEKISFIFHLKYSFLSKIKYVIQADVCQSIADFVIGYLIRYKIA